MTTPAPGTTSRRTTSRPPDRPWRSARLLVALTLCHWTAAGCGRSLSSTPKAPGSFAATFLGAGSPSDCMNQCWAKTVPVVRAGLGLDPDALGKYDLGRDRELLRALRAESEPTGGVLRPVPLPDLLRGLKEGEGTRAVLTDKNGHLYLLLGAIEEDGQTRCQLIHGDSSVFLLAKSEIAAAGFREAWELTSPPEGGVPMRVGSGAVTVNEMFHNFGHVKPEQKVHFTFVIKNAGGVPLTVGKPRPSCACTTTAVVEPTALGPGETLDLPVSVHVSDTISMRQFVQLTISERDGYASRDVLLSVTGSQVGSMKITPRSLDFGTVVPGRPASQTVMLEEMATDRFAVKAVDPGPTPLTSKVDVTEDHHGLRIYRIHCTLRADDASSGRHSEILTVLTDSRYYPKVSIPIAYDVAPFASAVPGTVALGEVPVGQPCRQQVRLVSRTGEPLTVEIQDAPAEADVQVDTQAEPVLTLTVTLKKPGIWQGVIRGKVRAGARSDSIEIPCAAYGKAG